MARYVCALSRFLKCMCKHVNTLRHKTSPLVTQGMPPNIRKEERKKEKTHPIKWMWSVVRHISLGIYYHLGRRDEEWGLVMFVERRQGRKKEVSHINK